MIFCLTLSRVCMRARERDKATMRSSSCACYHANEHQLNKATIRHELKIVFPFLLRFALFMSRHPFILLQFDSLITFTLTGIKHVHYCKCKPKTLPKSCREDNSLSSGTIAQRMLLKHQSEDLVCFQGSIFVIPSRRLTSP